MVALQDDVKRVVKRIKILFFERLVIIAKRFSRFVYKGLFLAECNEIVYTGDVIKRLEQIAEQAKQFTQEISIVNYSSAAW